MDTSGKLAEEFGRCLWITACQARHSSHCKQRAVVWLSLHLQLTLPCPGGDQGTGEMQAEGWCPWFPCPDAQQAARAVSCPAQPTEHCDFINLLSSPPG